VVNRLCHGRAASRTGLACLASLPLVLTFLLLLIAFIHVASVSWRKWSWPTSWDHQGDLLTLSISPLFCYLLLHHDILRHSICILQVLGTPTREEIKCMNPNYTEFKFPQIKAHPWHKVINIHGDYLALYITVMFSWNQWTHLYSLVHTFGICIFQICTLYDCCAFKCEVWKFWRLEFRWSVVAYHYYWSQACNQCPHHIYSGTKLNEHIFLMIPVSYQGSLISRFFKEGFHLKQWILLAGFYSTHQIYGALL
jgi:hypothetical protein